MWLNAKLGGVVSGTCVTDGGIHWGPLKEKEVILEKGSGTQICKALRRVSGA